MNLIPLDPRTLDVPLEARADAAGGEASGDFASSLLEALRESSPEPEPEPEPEPAPAPAPEPEPESQLDQRAADLGQQLTDEAQEAELPESPRRLEPDADPVGAEALLPVEYQAPHVVAGSLASDSRPVGETGFEEGIDFVEGDGARRGERPPHPVADAGSMAGRVSVAVQDSTGPAQAGQRPASVGAAAFDPRGVVPPETGSASGEALETPPASVLGAVPIRASAGEKRDDAVVPRPERPATVRAVPPSDALGTAAAERRESAEMAPGAGAAVAPESANDELATRELRSPSSGMGGASSDTGGASTAGAELAKATTASGPTAAPGTAPRPGSQSQPVEAIPQQVELLATRGGGTARLRLHPARLGEVEITVSTRGGNVEVVIRAEDPAAQAAVLATRDQLAEALASRELRMDGFSVTSGARDEPSRHDGFQPGSGQHDRGDPGSSPRRPGVEVTTQGDPRPVARSAAQGGSIDLRV